MKDGFIRKQVGRELPPMDPIEAFEWLNRSLKKLGVRPKSEEPVVKPRKIAGRTPRK